MYQSTVPYLVQVTGFEPTRLSTLEPETSASAVPPHLHLFLQKMSCTYRSFCIKQYNNITKMKVCQYNF